MKNTLFLICVLLYYNYSTAQIYENFSDGNFTTNPKWSGDDTLFKVNTSKELQLNANKQLTGLTYLTHLSTPNKLIDNTEWTFWVKLSFNTSDDNYARFYLATDTSDIIKKVTGYFVQVGSGIDDISLCRQKDDTVFSIIRSYKTKTSKSVNVVRIKVTRDNLGNWNLWCDSLGNTNYYHEGSGFDNTILSSDNCRIFCRFTKSNGTKIYFDDISISTIINDTTPPQVKQIEILSSNEIAITFSEQVDVNNNSDLLNFAIDNSIGNPDSIFKDIINGSTIHLRFKNSISEGNYKITISNIKDMKGNVMKFYEYNFSYYYPKTNEIVINEVLFNPKVGGVDFVEIYNRSNFNINLKDIVLLSYDTITNTIIREYIITKYTYYIKPSEYILITTNPDNIKKEYNTTNPNGLIKVDEMPQYNNESGVVVLATAKTNNIIDKFAYNSSMHFALLNNIEGVSLERINYNLPTQDRNNWHSASTSVGYATPAYKNSAFGDKYWGNNPITVSPELFSPDNDGYNDIANINYKFEEEGYVANVYIYDAKGRLVKYLIKNSLLSTSGSFVWDGTNDNNIKATVGIYIIYTEAFNLSGKVYQFKNIVTLAR